MKLRLYIGERQALVVQEFETLSKIVSMAFGDGGGKDEPTAPTPKSGAEAKAMFAALNL